MKAAGYELLLPGRVKEMLYGAGHPAPRWGRGQA